MLLHAMPFERLYVNVAAEIGKRLRRLGIPIGDEERYAPTRPGTRGLRKGVPDYIAGG